MKPNSSNSPTSAKADLLQDLTLEGSPDRERLLNLLMEQAPPPVEEIPNLPEDLRKRLEERFCPIPQQAPPATQPGFFSKVTLWLKETFAAHPLALGGLATACVAALLVISNTPETTKSKDTIRGNPTTDKVATTAEGVQWYWLGTTQDPLEPTLAPLLGSQKFAYATNLDEIPTPAPKAIVIAIDPQSGAWLKRAEGDPQPFVASGVPGSPEWPSAMQKAATEALAEAQKSLTPKP